MFWIKGLDGELINMAHVRLITFAPWTVGKAQDDRNWFVVRLWLTDPEGSKFSLDAFRGTAEECGRYRDDLRERMHRDCLASTLDLFANRLHDLFTDFATNISRST